MSTRWGGDEREPSEGRLEQVLAELDAVDDEHPDVALVHESGWTLSASSSGLVVFENVEDPDVEPRHLRTADRKTVLSLWRTLATGNIDGLQDEPWMPGYGD